MFVAFSAVDSVTIVGLTITIPAALGGCLGLVAVLGLWRWAKRRRRAAAQQAGLMARHEVAVSAFHEREQTWRQRRDALRTFLAVAEQAVSDGETVYGTVPATLFGTSEAGDDVGQLTITDRRLTFAGTRTEEWLCSEIAQLRHVGADRTVLQLRGEGGCAVVEYTEAPTARLLLDLVLSIPEHSRPSFIRTVAQGLNDHEMRRPEVPVPPAPAAGLGRRSRAKAASWHATRTEEADAMRSQVDAQVSVLPTQAVVSVEPVRTQAEDSLAS